MDTFQSYVDFKDCYKSHMDAFKRLSLHVCGYVAVCVCVRYGRLPTSFQLNRKALVVLNHHTTRARYL